MWGYFAQAAALGFGAAASPGPFQAFLLARALRSGLSRSLPLALAPLASDAPVVLLVLSVLTRAPPWLLRALQVAGGSFLLWLAWGTWRASAARPGCESSPEGEAGASFLRAMLVNALGPGPWIYWSTVAGPLVARAWGESPRSAVAFLCGFYLLLVGGNAALVVLFAFAGRIGPRVALALGRVSAAVMLGFGFLQLWRGVLGSSGGPF